MAVSADELGALDQALDGARLWGVELDTDYRVLAATFEPDADRHPREEVEDPRLQVLLFPVAEIAASLRRHEQTGEVRVETFEVDQLVDVVDSFDGARVDAPVLAAGERRLPTGPQGPELSLEGRSNAGDGLEHTFSVHLEGAGGRRLDLEATFDDVRVQDAAGQELPLVSFRA